MCQARTGKEEDEVIARAKRGEEAAFEALFHAHRRRVYSLCLRMARTEAEADDLTQEAFLQVFRKLATFRGEAAFTTWLHRLVVNIVIAHSRKNRLLQSYPVVRQGCEGHREPWEFTYSGGRQDDLVTRIGLETAISRLRPKWQAVFVLHELEGRDHSEIARMMNCSISNSRFLLHMARQKLRAHLRATNANAGARVGKDVKPAYSPIRAATTGERQRLTRQRAGAVLSLA